MAGGQVPGAEVVGEFGGGGAEGAVADDRSYLRWLVGGAAEQESCGAVHGWAVHRHGAGVRADGADEPPDPVRIRDDFAFAPPARCCGRTGRLRWSTLGRPGLDRSPPPLAIPGRLSLWLALPPRSPLDVPTTAAASSRAVCETPRPMRVAVRRCAAAPSAPPTSAPGRPGAPSASQLTFHGGTTAAGRALPKIGSEEAPGGTTTPPEDGDPSSRRRAGQRRCSRGDDGSGSGSDSGSTDGGGDGGDSGGSGGGGGDSYIGRATGAPSDP